MKNHTCNMMYGDAISTPVSAAILIHRKNVFARLGVDEFAAGEFRREPLVDEVQDVVDEGERDEEPDEQGADGVRDALAQLVEVLEERHPAFAAAQVVAERREPSLVSGSFGCGDSSSRLGNGTRAIAVDLPGHGLAAAPSSSGGDGRGVGGRFSLRPWRRFPSALRS